VAICALPVTIEANQVVVTASVGVAIGASSATGVAELLKDADTAMYRAKWEGGGRVQHFDAVVNEEIVVRHEIEAGLLEAIDHDQLHVAFDPVVSSDGEVVAYRTDLGWLHPRHGFVGSTALFGAASTTGISTRLADWMLDQTFVELGPWLASPSANDRFVVVDIVGEILTSSGFADRLEQWLRQHELDPSYVCLAIDGGYMTSHVDEVKAVIEPLNAFGVRIARVGVAASGSALTYLRSLPIDIIILDTALTDDLANNDDALLQLVIDTAKGGHRLVMAASVTSGDQHAALVSLGVDLVQTRAATTRSAPSTDDRRRLA
jgi:EAL domain-containing protein (putative c-di-GMP-specific phosphodiesterase class I)